MLVGAIEGGGTKFICGILSFGDGNNATQQPNIVQSIRIPTTSPEATLSAAVDFFQRRADTLGLESLGIGMFGPIDCDTRSSRWGYLLNTPKQGWADIDIGQRLQRALGVPVRLETDVAAAALGEWRWGAGRGTKTCVYATVGTGIGAGILIDGEPLRGHFHPEVGHMRVPRMGPDMPDVKGEAISGEEKNGSDSEKRPSFRGVCIHHGDCLEGLASGPAMKARWGMAPEDLPWGHPAWTLEAEYLAQAFVNLTLTVAPDRIIVGGGIGLRPGLLELVAERMAPLLGGYVRALDSVEALHAYLVRAELGSEAGLLGAAELGREAAIAMQQAQMATSEARPHNSTPQESSVRP